MIFLRLYLLAGLIAHKALWEVLKRRRRGDGPTQRSPLSLRTRLIKLVKLAILMGILLQTLMPDDWLSGLLIVANPEFLRVVGVVVYSAGLWIAMLGRLQLGSNWDDIETATVLDRQHVVSAGLYKYIRHPIYVGDLVMLLGLELSLNSWLVVGVAVLTPIVLSRAVREEKMLLNDLPGYQAYCDKTKRFVPFVW